MKPDLMRFRWAGLAVVVAGIAWLLVSLVPWVGGPPEDAAGSLGREGGAGFARKHAALADSPDDKSGVGASPTPRAAANGTRPREVPAASSSVPSGESPSTEIGHGERESWIAGSPDGRLGPPGPPPSENWRAMAVQREAEREVERMANVLGLSEAQKDRVFEIVAGTSPHFGEAMRVVTRDSADNRPGAEGAAAPSESLPSLAGDTPAGDRKTAREELIFETLDAEQQQALAEYVADQDAWWDEFIRVKEDELVASGVGSPSIPSVGSPTAEPDPPAPDYGGGDASFAPSAGAVPATASPRGKQAGKQSFSLPPAGLPPPSSP